MQSSICRFCNRGIEAADNFCRYCGGKNPTERAASEQGMGVDGDIKNLILAGRGVEAIKAIRERTGMGLKEAKDLADSIGRTIGKK